MSGMDLQMIRDHLALRQRTGVLKFTLRGDARAIKDAKLLLAHFQVLQDMHEADRDRLRRLAENSPPIG